LKEEEIEEDNNKERQTGEERKTRQDSKLKKTRIGIPGLY
jgi:hypothetical protein